MAKLKGRNGLSIDQTLTIARCVGIIEGVADAIERYGLLELDLARLVAVLRQEATSLGGIIGIERGETVQTGVQTSNVEAHGDGCESPQADMEKGPSDDGPVTE